MRVAPLAIMLAACAFEPSPATTTSDSSTADAAAGAPDASMAMAGDPCGSNNGGCAVACMTVGGSAVCYAPETCGQLGNIANDSSQTLYVGGSAAKPWTAFCHDGDEYLAVGSATNFGQYTAGGNSPGSNVRTSYAKLRVDPGTLVVDICDQTFASSTGSLSHDPGNTNPPVTVTSMPLGVAMDCKGDSSNTGAAGVDLTGTPFTVMSGWATGGFSASGNAQKNGRVSTISGGGNCGWDGPSGIPGNPFNTFANSKLLMLTYSP